RHISTGQNCHRLSGLSWARLRPYRRRDRHYRPTKTRRCRLRRGGGLSGFPYGNNGATGHAGRCIHLRILCGPLSLNASSQEPSGDSGLGFVAADLFSVLTVTVPSGAIVKPQTTRPESFAALRALWTLEAVLMRR